VGGKTADVAYMYDNQPIVVFDLPRDSADFTNYGTIEHMKDGQIISPKYTSVCKMFDVPHVIVFANFLPDMNKLSVDRWRIVNLQ